MLSEDVVEHEQGCEYRLEPCPLGCPELVQHRLLDEHQQVM